MFSASSQARAAATIGLRGKATEIPVLKWSAGAAVAAAAIDIHGVWLVSVNSIPEKPLASTSRASWAAPAQVDGPTIRSNCTCPPLRPAGDDPAAMLVSRGSREVVDVSRRSLVVRLGLVGRLHRLVVERNRPGQELDDRPREDVVAVTGHHVGGVGDVDVLAVGALLQEAAGPLLAEHVGQAAPDQQRRAG